MKAVPFVLALLWGLNWPAVKIVLGSVDPFLFRFLGLGSAALILFAMAGLRGVPLRVDRAMRGGVMVAGLLNIAAFNLSTAFAQLATSTSRAAVLTFTMPLWSALFARIWLRERLDGRRRLALCFGAAGVGVLAWPLLAGGERLAGLVFPLIAAIGWAAGTVFLKARPLAGDGMVLTAWQLVTGAAVAAIGVALHGERLPDLPLSWPVALALGYHVLLATALAYALWFAYLARGSATASALTTLMIPVVGVVGAMLLVGDRPGPLDLSGFVLVLCAAFLALGHPAAAPRRPVG